MEKFGIKVKRITKKHVLYNQAIVIEMICGFIDKAACPSPLGEGDGRG
jgi:hypothetical protein